MGHHDLPGPHRQPGGDALDLPVHGGRWPSVGDGHRVAGPMDHDRAPRRHDRAPPVPHHRVHPPGPHARSTWPSRSARPRCSPAAGSSSASAWAGWRRSSTPWPCPSPSGGSGPTRCSRCSASCGRGRSWSTTGALRRPAARDAPRADRADPDPRRRHVRGGAAPRRPATTVGSATCTPPRSWRRSGSRSSATARSTTAPTSRSPCTASAMDAWDLDGYRRVHEAGVTHLVTMPWYFYAGADADLRRQGRGHRAIRRGHHRQVVTVRR